MKNKLLWILINVVCCIAFLALPILFAPDTPIYWFEFNSYALHHFTLYLLFIAFYYLNFFVLVPRIYFSKLYVIYFLVCLLCFFIIIYIPDLILPAGSYGASAMTALPPGAAPPFVTDVEQSHFQKPFILPHISDNFFLFIIVTFVSMTLRINGKLKRTEKEKTEAQLSYLQSQINPHFLFNTLNSIYSLALMERSVQTSSAVIKLSGLMRYVTTEAGRDLVDLDKEITYISNYIDLQKVRLGNTVNVSYQVTGIYADKRIVPLLLMPFIENAFKHGVNPEQDSDISVTIDIKGYDLHMRVVNNKVYHTPGEEAKSGVGIKNTKKRLELLYPSRHLLTIDDGASTYTLSLHLHLA